MKSVRYRIGASIVLGVAISLAGVGAFALASGSISGAQIRACVANASGVVRIPASSQPCLVTEHELVWNAQGAPGRDGLSGVRYVSVASLFYSTNAGPPAQDAQAAASCRAGETVIGGGVRASGVTVLESGPLVDHSGWTAAVHFDPNDSVTGEPSFSVTAICAATPLDR